jgi:hypothetical protein
MVTLSIRAATTASFLALAACGGGGGGMASAPVAVMAPTPAPTATPVRAPLVPATDRIIAGATATQAFATYDYAPGWAGGLDISFDAPTGTYLVATPAEVPATPLIRSANYQPQPGNPWQIFTANSALFFQIRASAEFSNPDVRYTYSNLASWGYPDSSVAHTAFGIATPAAGVPLGGTGTYTGFIEGRSSEKCNCGWDGESMNGWLSGTVALTFDFAKGDLSGYVAPVLEMSKNYSLGEMPLSGVRWTAGSPQFSSSFAGQGISNAALAGTLTGPAAQELIGRMSFNYVSPIDQTSQAAGGAFIAKK